MANTVITLKKSSSPSVVPADLANGELAINYADGKLFFKNTAGYISEISGSAGGISNFGTVNAAGTLIIADVSNDILTINKGDNINITGDAINDALTISADLSPANNYAVAIGTAGNNYTNQVGAAGNNYNIIIFNQANAAFEKANSPVVNAFSIINVSSQSNVTASLSSDTLILEAGGGINITTNSTTKTVTFSQASTIDYGLIDGLVTNQNDYGSIA